MPVNKTVKTMEEIEKESDMPPEFEFDPILDIIKEADEKLNFIKTVPKKEPGKGKKKKSSKTKVSKANKAKKVSVKNDQEQGESLSANSNSEPTKSSSEDDILDQDTKEDSLESINNKNGNKKQAKSGKTRNKTAKRKKSKGKKGKKTKRESDKISERINLAMNLVDTNVDDKLLQVKLLSLIYSYSSFRYNNQCVGST